MAETSKQRIYDVLIAGAGPAGCTCALALKDAGLTIALMDSKAFPRDKVCGDAIPLRAIKTLLSIDPAFAAAFNAFEPKLTTRSTAIIYNGKQVTFDWVKDAYTCTRMEFDNLLFSLVKSHTGTDTYTPLVPEKYTQAPDGIYITTNEGTVIKTKMLIGADGAHSMVAKQLTNKTLDRNHHVGSVRAYYSNVEPVAGNTIEIWFNKQYMPGYFWIFPLAGNKANVGFGMLSADIARRKVNLKRTFYAFIDHLPELKKRFSGAVQISQLEGFGLPLGSKPEIISGAHFMLAGDAASLVDPITGEGIGNAMLSGKLAAEQVTNCFRNSNFSADTMKAYDNSLRAAIGKEMRTRYRAQQAVSKMPFLLDLIFLGCCNPFIKKLLQRAM